MAPSRPIQWLRARPSTADALLAATLAVVSVAVHLASDALPDYDAPSAAGVLLTLGATLPVAWRRRNPAAAVVAAVVAQAAMEASDLYGPGWVGLVICTYSLAAYGRSPRREAAGAVVALVVALLLVTGLVIGEAGVGDVAGSLFSLTTAYVVGDNVRRRRERLEELTERAERAERERELLANQAVLAERSRIARELHDVVAHAVSLMVIQAGAARRQLDHDPARAAAAIEQVERTGRDAMQEMRRVLGVLRGTGPAVAPARAPQPGLDDLEDLVAAAAPLPVALHREGLPAPLPAGVGLSAYRIVQEALTNVRKHAGHPHRVDVTVRTGQDSVIVEVADDGRGASVERNAEGHGLVGIRERAALCGGTAVAGPRPGGGWLVRATLPVTGANGTPS